MLGRGAGLSHEPWKVRLVPFVQSRNNLSIHDFAVMKGRPLGTKGSLMSDSCDTDRTWDTWR